MRNYVKLYVLRVDFTATAPHFTSLPFIGSNLLGAYENVSETLEGIEAIRTDAQNIAAANGCSAVFQDTQERFFTLDKSSLVALVNASVITALPSGYGGADSETPRYTGWFDADGNERKPAPSDKKGGRPGKFVPPETLLQALQTFAGALITAGYRTGGKKNLLTELVTFIVALVNKKAIDMKALENLLERIHAAIG